jgi:hypothetical protein
MPRLYAQRDDSVEPRGWRVAAAACGALDRAVDLDRDYLDRAAASR